MGNFLNILIEDRNQEKQIVDYFQQFYDIQKVKIEYVDTVEILENENYYFIYNQEGVYIENFIINNKKIPISDLQKDLIQRHKNVFFIFLNDNECDTENLIEILDYTLESLNLNTEQFYVINANENLKFLIDKNKSKIKTLDYSLCKFRAVRNMIDYDFDFPENNRKFLFSCYNRSLKPHRIAILSLLNKKNILKEIDWTSLRGDIFKTTYLNSDSSNDNIDYLETFFYGIYSSDKISEIYDELVYLGNCGYKKSDLEKDYDFDEGLYTTNWDLSYSNAPFLQSYINIVTESNFSKKQIIHITEKSLVPFYYYQIPIILASPHHVKHMKEAYDFDFFEDLVNHNYDNEYDDEKRINMVVDEIINLNSRKEYIEKFFLENKERFINNKNKLKKLLDLSNVKNEINKLI